jgi:hypothetical protein
MEFEQNKFILEAYFRNGIDIIIIKCVSQSRTGLQIYEGHDDQLNRQGPMV